MGVYAITFKKAEESQRSFHFHLHRLHIYLCNLEVKNKNWVHLQFHWYWGIIEEVGCWKLEVEGKKVRVFRWN